jgi:hypothetical protein
MKRPDVWEVKRMLQAVLNNAWLRDFATNLASHVIAGVLAAEVVQHVL